MFKTPTKDTLVDSAVQVGSVLAGGMLSDGVVSLAGESLGGKTVTKAVITGAGLVGSASVKGKDTLSKALKYSLLGMAIFQGYGMIHDLVVDKNLIDKPTEDSSTTDKVVAAMFGLKCPGECSQRNYAPSYVSGLPSLNMPMYQNQGLDTWSFEGQNEGVPVLSEADFG